MASEASGGESGRVAPADASGKPMRLGFVGVGVHAQKMAAAFRECGAEIVAFDRTRNGLDAANYIIGDDNPIGAVDRLQWTDMVRSSMVDAIVCCAPPEVTARVAAACLDAAKPCCATKPLMWDKVPEPSFDSPENISRGLYVDLWRLYSPAWLALKADLRGKIIKSVHVDFYGNGPVRETHSGLMDYGPHALAFVLDLGVDLHIEWKRCADGRWRATGTDAGNHSILIYTGNEAKSSSMVVHVEVDGGGLEWMEYEGSHIYRASQDRPAAMWHERDLALRNFCRAFMAGEPSDTLRISCEAMRLLKKAEPW